MVKVNIIEITGIKIRIYTGKVKVCNNIMFNRMLRKPIRMAVTIERDKVASMFSSQLFLLNSPIIKSLAVLAINGPLILPLKDNNAGMIRINIAKLLNGRINNESRIPARTPPIIETNSEGKVSLTILPLP